MDNSKTEALQALTATYTDSEDDAGNSDIEDTNNIDDGVVSKSPVNITMEEVEEQQKQKTVAKLVSYYHDDNDMVISEDDTEKENSMNTSAEPTPTEEKNIELIPEDDEIQLPPEPSGRCSQDLQDKITQQYEKMQSRGLDMNEVIQRRKAFRNPSIYEKLIQFCAINELGTNYPASLYDPLRWGKESYYEELAKAQKEEMDKKNKEQKEKTKVEIVMGTAKKTTSSSATVIKASGVAVDDKNRKSKWDQVTSAGASLGPMVGPMLPSAPLTTTATGTKGTVISAFGSLPKKVKTSQS